MIESCADFRCLLFQVFSLTFYEANMPILDLSIGPLVSIFHRVLNVEAHSRASSRRSRFHTVYLMFYMDHFTRTCSFFCLLSPALGFFIA